MSLANASLVNRFTSIMKVTPSRRRVKSPLTEVAQSPLEAYESRILPAASVYGVWSLSLLPPDSPPDGDPGPYLLEIYEGGDSRIQGKVQKAGKDFGTVHIPGQGVVAFKKVKVAKDGQSVKAKIKSPPFKGKLEARLVKKQDEIEAILSFVDKSVKLSEDFKLKGPQAP